MQVIPWFSVRMTVLEVKMGWKKYSLVLVSFLIAALFLVVAPGSGDIVAD